MSKISLERAGIMANFAPTQAKCHRRVTR
jgi:hypothetical protein